MNTDIASPSPRPLSTRHERFVLEFLKDGNATQAYLRAGYSPRGAQPSAAKLLRRPDVDAAITAGRARQAEALEITIERIGQEYAKIAMAKVDDFISTDADGRLRIDLDKATEAQRAGIVEIRLTNNRKQEQQVVLKLGKMQALAALTKHAGLFTRKPQPGLTAEDRERYETKIVAHERNWQHARDSMDRLTRERDQAQIALVAAEAKLKALGSTAPQPKKPEEPEQTIAKHVTRPEQEPQQESPPKPHVEPGMPTEPLPDHLPGLHPYAKFVWSGGREHRLGPDSADALRMMKPGGFPGR